MKTQKTMFTTLGLMLLLLSGSFLALAETGSNASTEPGNGATPETGTDTVVETDTHQAPGTESGGGGKGVSAKVAVSISPKRQFAEKGETVSYEVTIEDLHLRPTCRDAEKIRCPGPSYEYKLSFESEEGTVGEFEQEKITLEPQEKKTIKLSVTSESRGANVFLVTATSSDGETRAGAKGVLVIVREATPEPQRAFFIGDGFALSEDEETGILVNIKLLNKAGDIKGKLGIAKRTFDIKGALSDEEVTLDLSLVGGKDIEGTFKGTIKKYKTFLLLEGKLAIEDLPTYDLTATSKKEGAIRDIGKEEVLSTKIKEIVAVEGSIETESGGTSSEVSKDDFYIRPMKIKEEKILWIFPTGKKILEVEVIKEGKVSKEEIKENTKKKIEGYNIEVGSLEDEDKIEFTAEAIKDKSNTELVA